MTSGKRVSLEILVQTPLKKQLDALGPIASQGRSVQVSVKYVDDKKIPCQDPP